MPPAIPVRRAVLVSDLHLRRPEGERTRLFLDFVARRLAPDPPELLVVAGDLFDFCTAVRRRLPAATRPALGALEALPRVIWLEGNHDFRLAAGLGASPIEARSTELALRWAGRAVHVQHGDFVTRTGRWTRRLLCSAPAAAGAWVLGVEGAWRVGSAVGLSRSGEHGYDGRRPDWLADATRYAAGRRRLGFDLTILGHGHWLGRWDELICLGDWPRCRSYLELCDDGEAVLRRYEPDSPEDPAVERDPSPR